MPNLTPAERELLSEVRHGEWMNLSDHSSPADAAGHGALPPSSEIVTSENEPPWYRRRLMLLALCLLMISWMGWPVALIKHAEVLYQRGEADEAQQLAADRAEMLEEQEDARERMQAQRDALYGALDQAVTDFELLQRSGRLDEAGSALRELAAAEALESDGTLDLDAWRVAMNELLADARADELGAAGP